MKLMITDRRRFIPTRGTVLLLRDSVYTPETKFSVTFLIPSIKNSSDGHVRTYTENPLCDGSLAQYDKLCNR